MKSVVDEPLRDIHGAHAFFRLQFVAEDDLVHARRVIRQIVCAFESFANVVGVQNGVFGGLAKTVRAVRLNVGEGADEHPKVSVESAHTPDRMWTVVFETESAVSMRDYN